MLGPVGIVLQMIMSDAMRAASACQRDHGLKDLARNEGQSPRDLCSCSRAVIHQPHGSSSEKGVSYSNAPDGFTPTRGGGMNSE